MNVSRYSDHSWISRCRLVLNEKHSESERKVNWLLDKNSTYFGKIRKRSESVREECGVILNQTSRSSCTRKGFGNDSRRMLDVCGKHSQITRIKTRDYIEDMIYDMIYSFFCWHD